MTTDPDQPAPTRIVLAPEVIDIARRLQDARNAKREWEAVEKDLRDQILAEMEDADDGVDLTGKVVVSVKKVPTSRVNSKKLRALWPDIYEDVVSESTQKRVITP